MNFEKVTLFASNVENESKLLKIFGFDITEQNKVYNKHNINNTVFSVNNRQKGITTNYLFEFEINANSKNILIETLEKNNITFFLSGISNNVLEISENDFKYRFEVINKELKFKNEVIEYNLVSLSLNTVLNENNLLELNQKLNLTQNKNTLLLNCLEFDITLYLNQNENSVTALNMQKLSDKTPISLLMSIDDNYEQSIEGINNKLNYTVIFSGQSAIVTEIK